MCNHRRRSYRAAYPNYRATGYRRPKHNVPVNIIEYDDRFEAYVYALGFSKEHIQITISNDTLYISGTRTPDEDRPNFLLQEYPIKSFERWFELSEKADQTKVSAEMVNGILIITVAKTAKASQPDVDVAIN